ncbi:MAG TPA: DUF3016 domain-containing protein [Rhodanobacteraceae bacterium]|nr:DUF3016 domain-containing protein [Rhodanobacteraceae bacterium]
MDAVRIVPRMMGIATFVLALAAPGAAVGGASSHRVSILYYHPQHFTEARDDSAATRVRVDDGYLASLTAWIEQRAVRVLKPQQRLRIVILDIDRAGGYEPTLGGWMSEARVVRESSRPRIELAFAVADADGTVVREGRRSLANLRLRNEYPGLSSKDPMLYEKALIDKWLSKGPAAL